MNASVYVLILTASNNFSSLDRRLNVTVYRKVYSMSEIDCIMLCVVDECCRGTNYWKTQIFAENMKENCEILYEVDTEFTSDVLVREKNYNYLKLRNPSRVS